MPIGYELKPVVGLWGPLDSLVDGEGGIWLPRMNCSASSIWEPWPELGSLSSSSSRDVVGAAWIREDSSSSW